MLDEGYAAATSRPVAAKAGVKPTLVHYYFPSMDDLFVAVLRDKAEENMAHQREAIAETQPVRALWQLNETLDAQLFTEFLAMANHRKAIRSEIVAYATRFRAAPPRSVSEATPSHAGIMTFCLVKSA
jgi:AcrR family transcriptional regulator